MIESKYIELLSHYKVDLSAAKEYWKEVNTNYSEPNRAYHNLEHLEDLVTQLSDVKHRIKKWNVMLFTLFYHDIIYKSTKSNNEEKSAELASKRMLEMGVDELDIKLCYEQIVASKYHKESGNSDTNYFTDADLSILGREQKVYKDYCQKIRKEYSIYPNILYKRGRKKVINHFLSMERIFKTKEFYTKFEEQARFNLKEELEIL